jgi:hypothetical protein
VIIEGIRTICSPFYGSSLWILLVGRVEERLNFPLNIFTEHFKSELRTVAGSISGSNICFYIIDLRLRFYWPEF